MTDKTDAPDRPERASDRDILTAARERFRLSADAEDTLRKNQLEDKRFAAGDQWPEKVKKQRALDGRPCLTIDRLKPQIKQVTNQQRAMRPSALVHPVDNGADVETAEVLQGMIRHIETQSDADDAYDQAGRDQTEIGRGWFRILTEYCDDSTLNQEIRIARVRNPFTIYPDPMAQKRDYSDGRFLFVVEDLPLDEFKARYPRAAHVSLEEFQSLGDDTKYWTEGESIRIAEYWRVEVDRVELKVGDRMRTVERRRVLCDKISGLEVLESYDWPGKYIPVVPVIGEEIDLDGKVDYRGMVRAAKDPQQMFNIWKSATTEMIALAPRAPFIMAEGQDEGYEAMWKQANQRNFPVLKYKPKMLNGEFAPPPQRNIAEPPIQALLQSTQGAENDLRATTGFFDVNQTERREQSGTAIRARQQQGEHGNADYIDGLARGIRHGARILIDLIPKIYDAQRVLRITGKDGAQRTVMVHAGQPPDVSALPEGKIPGIDGIYDLNAGVYDVTVSVGPSQQSSRAEFVENMTAAFSSTPGLFQFVGDLYFKHMDFAGAQEVAERLKKMLPPQLQDEGQQSAIPPQAQAQIQQLTMMLQQAQAELQQAKSGVAQAQIKAESSEKIAAAQLASKEQIAALQADVDRMKAVLDAQVAQQKIDADRAKLAMQANIQRESQQAQLQAQREAQANDHLHAAASQQQEHAHASHMQATAPKSAGGAK